MTGTLDVHFYTLTFYHLARPRYILSYRLIFSSLENDDMESSKRYVKLLWVIFILKCLTELILFNRLSPANC